MQKPLLRKHTSNITHSKYNLNIHLYTINCEVNCNPKLLNRDMCAHKSDVQLTTEYIATIITGLHVSPYCRTGDNQLACWYKTVHLTAYKMSQLIKYYFTQLLCY